MLLDLISQLTVETNILYVQSILFYILQFRVSLILVGGHSVVAMGTYLNFVVTTRLFSETLFPKSNKLTSYRRLLPNRNFQNVTAGFAV